MAKNAMGKELGRGISEHNGYFYGRFVNRYGKRISVCNKDKKELIRKFNRLKYEDECRISTNGLTGITVDKFFDKCVNDIFQVRNTTLQNYQCGFKHISSHIGTIDIALVTPLHILEIINDLKKPYIDSRSNKEKRYSINTIRGIKALCFNIFQQAKIMQIIKDNPALDIKVKDYTDVICENGGYEKSLNKKALTANEQMLFLAAAQNSNHYILFLLLFHTGLRVSEALALCWSDIDFDRKTIKLKRTFVEVKVGNKYVCQLHPPKSESSFRIIAINEEIIGHLMMYKEKTSKIKRASNEFGNLIFITQTGKHCLSKSVRNSMNCITRNLRKKGVDIHMNPHKCRHSMVCRLYEENIDIVTISRRLGHKKISTTTDIYLHVFEEVEARKLEQISHKET